MASISGLKLARTIEWKTEKLDGIRPWCSPTFIFQGKKCFLMLSVDPPRKEIPYGTDLLLHICGAQRLVLPFKVQVFLDEVNFPHILSFPVKTVKDQSDCIWECPIAEICNRLNLSSEKIGNLCFKIMIYEDEGSTDNKCVQTGSYLNADKFSESLAKDFSFLLESGLYQDAVIKCGMNSIKVHKVVLCARSTVFRAMMQSDLQESQTGVIEIKDMDNDHFMDFIKFLYTDTMPELTLRKATGLYEAGDRYDVRSLKLRCSEYLQDNLSLENAFECFVLADAHSDQKFKDRIRKYILDAQIYLLEEFWLPFCESFPKLANEVYRLSYEKKQTD